MTAIGPDAHNEAMPTGVLIPVEKYLQTSYEPDCEYQDGALIERNVGESPHSWLQGLLCAYLWRRSKKCGIIPYPEQRVQIREGKYLIPDIYVHHGPRSQARIFTGPPLIWVEILSCEDKPVRVARKVGDAVQFGAAYVWVIDPETLESYVTTKDSEYELRDGVFKIAEIGLTLPLHNLEEES